MKLQGHPRLVNAIGKLYSKLLNRDLDPNNEVIVTAGAYEALFIALQGHTSPGDEWIIIEPYFDCYVPMVVSAGGIPRCIPLKPVSSLLPILFREKRGHNNERINNKKKKIFSISFPQSFSKTLVIEKFEKKFLGSTFGATLSKDHNPSRLPRI